MMKKLLLSLLLVSSTAFGALTDVDKAQAGATNVLTNPGFENGKASWTSSGGTLAVATSGSNLLIGKSSVTWDSTAASQTLTSDYFTVSNGLKGTNGEFGCKIMVPSGTAAHSLQVFNGSTVLGSLSIADSGTNPKPFTGVFPIPTSGSLALRILSTASNEPTITVDDCYLGSTRSIGSVQVISDWKACSNVGAGTLWTSTGTSPVYGTSASANNFQGIKCFWRRNAENAEIQFDYHQTTAGALPSGMALFNINAVSPELVIDQNKIKANQNTTVGTFASANSGQPSGFMATSAGYIHNLYAVLHGTLGTQIKFHMSYTGVGQGGLILGNTSSWFDQTEASMGLRMSFPIVGWSATANAVRSDNTNYAPRSYTPIFTGFGTVVTHNCTESRDGAYLVWECTFLSGVSTAVEARVSLPSGINTKSTVPTISLRGNCGRTGGGSDYPTVTIEASKNYVTFGQGSSGGSTVSLAKLNGNQTIGTGETFSCTARIPIEGWLETQNAPVLIGGITNGGQGALRLESAQVTAAGVVTELNGSDWLNGNCSVATSTFTCLFNSGLFLAAPHCQLTLYDTGAGDEKITVATTGSVVVALTNPGVGNIAYPFTLMCLGQR